jgi:hypothetical protein
MRHSQLCECEFRSNSNGSVSNSVSSDSQVVLSQPQRLCTRLREPEHVVRPQTFYQVDHHSNALISSQERNLVCTYISRCFVVPVRVDVWLRRCGSFRAHVEMGAASTRILSTHWRCSSVTAVREICRHCCVILQRVANKLTGLEVDSTSR